MACTHVQYVSQAVLWYLAECDGVEIWCVYFQKTVALDTANWQSYIVK